jgi:hypothetical protein
MRARLLASPSRAVAEARRGVACRDDRDRDRDRSTILKPKYSCLGDLSLLPVLLLSAIPNASFARTLLV